VNVLVIALRVFFALLLVASAIGKLLDMPGFYAIVATYQTLPVAIIPAAAWTLTLVELALGIWVASGVRLSRAAMIVVALHVMYFIWLSMAFARGLSIPNCGCFGVYFARPFTLQTLLEDTLLLALAATLWWLAARARPRSAAT
jgi:uncharacterized membrane protein YphA (DoxX/SURF4 family)